MALSLATLLLRRLPAALLLRRLPAALLRRLPTALRRRLLPTAPRSSRTALVRLALLPAALRHRWRTVLRTLPAAPRRIGRIGLLILSIAAVAPGRSAANQQDALSRHRQPTALLASVAVIPLLVIKTPFYKGRRPFTKILRDNLTGATERADVNETDFFLGHAGGIDKLPVDRHAKSADDRAAGQSPHLRIPG